MIPVLDLSSASPVKDPHILVLCCLFCGIVKKTTSWNGIIKENKGCYRGADYTCHSLLSGIKPSVQSWYGGQLWHHTGLICFLSTKQEKAIPHIPEPRRCSLRMTFNLSLHQSMSGRGTWGECGRHRERQRQIERERQVVCPIGDLVQVGSGLCV